MIDPSSELGRELKGAEDFFELAKKRQLPFLQAIAVSPSGTSRLRARAKLSAGAVPVGAGPMDAFPLSPAQGQHPQSRR
jgi:hypothetical protein